MDSARWDRVKALFHDALEQPAAERPAWLCANCPDDAEVAAEALALLAAHAATAPEPATADARWIGRYRVLALLGEGGFGTVHLAEQHEPVHRQVALKVLRPGMDSAQVVARFALEREALARMSHPNIAHIYDAGTTAAGLPFFAMEYVDGTSLVPYCDRHRLPLASRLRLFVQVCRGVHHAHQKGVIHRDLKPSNVLVATVDGLPVPKIIDFGIAKALASADRPGFGEQPTLEGRCLGTPGYMSPEQADLTGGQVDVRTDVYSLGILLYELLTGRLPHDPSTVAQRGLLSYLQQVREADPARPSTTATSLDPAAAATRGMSAATLRRRLRGDLDWITLKALERDPARRYQSADDIAEDLERHLRHEPVLAGPPGFGYRLRKFVRRHRAVAASSLAIVLALVFGLGASLWQYGIARANLRAATGHRLSAQAINLAEEAPTLALLLAIAGAEHAPGEDADAALYTALGLHLESRQAPLHDGIPLCAAVSADGRSMLSGDDTQLVICRELESGEVRHRFDQHEHRLAGVAIDRGGRYGASFDTQGVVRLLDLQRGIELACRKLPATLRAAVFLDEEGTLLLGAANGSLYRCGRDGASIELVAAAAELLAMRPTPDGQTLAVLRGNDTITLHALADGRPIATLALPPGPAPVDRAAKADLQFTADGRWLVCLDTQGRLLVHDRQDPQRPWFPSALGCWAFALASQANLLAFCEAHGALAVVGLDDRRRLELPATNRPMENLVMDAAGHTLVGTAHNQPLLRIFDPVLGQCLATVRGDNHALYGAAISPDGQWVDALGHNGAAHRWRTAALGEERRLAQRLAHGTVQGAVPIPPGDQALCWWTTGDRSRYALVDVVRGTELVACGELAGRQPAVALTPRHDAAILDWTAGTVVLRLPDGKPLFRCDHHLLRPRCTADLTYLVGLSGPRVQVFDLRRGTLVFDQENVGTQFADVTPDGTRLVIADGSRNTTTVWSLTPPQPQFTIQHAAFAFDARFTPDGRQVVALANDTTAQIVDAATGQLVRQLRMPTGDFGWVLPDPSGRFLVLQTPEETCIHELATGQRRLRWAPSDGRQYFEEMAFRSDGNQLLVNMPDGRFRRLPLEPLAAAREQAPRELTAAERQRYDLPPPATPEPVAARSSRSLVDSAMALLEEEPITAARLATAQQHLDHARALRTRLLPRYHLARAMLVSRRGELDGAVSREELATALADAQQCRELFGGAGERALATRRSLQWLRGQPGFAAAGPGGK